MGCNCKSVKKIQNLIPNANHSQVERKGIKKLLYKIIDDLQNLWVKILVAIVIAVAIPIVFLILIGTLFFQGRPTVPMPKKIVEKLIKKENES